MGSARLSLLGLFIFLSTCDLRPLSRPSNGLRDCRSDGNTFVLEVLPGGGWDNLRNLDMGRVMSMSYSQCQTTEDRVYLIPDEVFVIPQKVSRMERNSEIITSWLKQKSSTSGSINADVFFFSLINGKYSSENQRMKTHQVKEKSVTARTQVRNHLYTAKTYSDFTLDSRFARQAEEIADAIENNQTRQAEYLSEKMVLDYGTHVITSVDAGATLLVEDYLKSSYVSDAESSHSSVSATASSNFFKITEFKMVFNDTQKTSAYYEGNTTYSITLSHGGALFYPGITLQKWQESTINNLVAIDRSGLPLHYFLNPAMFPDLPLPTVNKLALSVSQAIERYYKINTRPGCLKPDSKNFNFQANVDDRSCEGPSTNLSFGGVYQECTPITQDGDVICQELGVVNPATSSYSCQQPYTATLLRSEYKETPYSKYVCRRNCESCGLLYLSTCCNELCENVNNVRQALIKTFWCSTNEEAPKFSGYHFGGLYGPFLQNPLTKSRSCPSDFVALKFLSNGLMICLSNDYEAGTRFSVPFGGLFSCQSTNPLAGNQSCCPPQFSQHLAAISDGCQVLYCVRSGIFTEGELLPIHLPPFTRPPVITMIATNTVAVMTEGDRAWVRVKDTKMWKMAKPGDILTMSQTFEDSPKSAGIKAGVAIGALVLFGLIVAVIVT